MTDYAAVEHGVSNALREQEKRLATNDRQRLLALMAAVIATGNGHLGTHSGVASESVRTAEAILKEVGL